MSKLQNGLSRLREGDWQAAHEIAQADTTPLGAWLHGIVHLMEGDVGNARYWYSRAGRGFPPLDRIGAELDALEMRVNRGDEDR